MQGGSEVSGIRDRAGGAAFSQMDVLAEAIGPFLRPSPTEQVGAISESPST